MAERDGTTADGRGRLVRGRRALWIAHAAIMLLLLVHAQLMATGQCAALMGPHHGAAAFRETARHPGLPEAAPAQAAAQHRPMRAPVVPPVGVCPAQQAVLPLLALALASLLALLGRGGLSPIALAVSAARAPFDALAPPLDARRRRALLQVFLN
jgi:hypothetical protein